jgi:hypothetical protein
MTDVILANQHVMSGRNWTNNYRWKKCKRKSFNLNLSFIYNFCSISVINIWIVRSKHVKSALPTFSTIRKIENPKCVEYGTISFSTMVPRFRISMPPPSWGYFMKSDCRKVKCTLVQALRLCTGRMAHRGSRGIALPFLDHGPRKGWGVSLTPRPLFTPGKNPVPISDSYTQTPTNQSLFSRELDSCTRGKTLNSWLPGWTTFLCTSFSNC